MTTTVGELKGEARVLVRAGEIGAALSAYDHILAHNPLDYGCRLKVADMLARLGDAGGAGALYRALALHNLRAGHAAPALVACKELERLGQPTDDIVGELAATYAQGAPALAKFAARQAPVDDGARVPRPDLTGSEPVAAVAQRARARALDFSVYTGYPQQFLPLAFLSELPATVFPPVIRALKLQRLGDGDLVIREGEPGVAFYLVGGGQVRVFATDSLGRQTERARLHEAALFGEMSLLTAQPRTASVQVIGDADIIEVGRDALAALAAEIPTLGAALDRFARERLLKNLLATSPLFKPFNRQQQMDLVRRFDGHEARPRGLAGPTARRRGVRRDVADQQPADVGQRARRAPVDDPVPGTRLLSAAGASVAGDPPLLRGAERAARGGVAAGARRQRAGRRGGRRWGARRADTDLSRAAGIFARVARRRLRA